MAGILLSTKILALALLSVSFAALAQVLLKKAVTDMPPQLSSAVDAVSWLLSLPVNPFLIAGVMLYVASLALWLIVLSRAEVSAAYPMASVGFLITAVVAHYTLGESVTLWRIGGILLICAGMFLVTH